jgi:hypothetical protein
MGQLVPVPVHEGANGKHSIRMVDTRRACSSVVARSRGEVGSNFVASGTIPSGVVAPWASKSARFATEFGGSSSTGQVGEQAGVHATAWIRRKHDWRVIRR